MLVQFVLFDGFDPMDVIGPLEVLSAARAFTDEVTITVELVCAEGDREVPSGVHGVSLRAVARLDPDRADLVVVPGAAGRLPGHGEDQPGAEAVCADAGAGASAGVGVGVGADADTADEIPAILARALTTELSKLLAQALAAPATTVATVCGGSLLLAMAGLLHGRHATTHHQGLDVLAAAGARVVPGRVVDDGDLVTAGGVTSGLDLGLYLLERAVGPQIAIAVEQLFAYERRGVVWRDQAPARVSAASHTRAAGHASDAVQPR
ncbi:DJ-1/PfpI family protein [Streptacidiphilus melanogenes]|uniref:DJ-1/PfpI family protein n=1 Tax=Streptacidiphilus melanogenes TaxID=411235 RepID=UPI0005AB82AC|nr:DJ-1/PfpI family protein [Streptacidiphilus melanogenes]